MELTPSTSSASISTTMKTFRNREVQNPFIDPKEFFDTNMVTNLYNKLCLFSIYDMSDQVILENYAIHTIDAKFNCQDHCLSKTPHANSTSLFALQFIWTKYPLWWIFWCLSTQKVHFDMPLKVGIIYWCTYHWRYIQRKIATLD